MLEYAKVILPNVSSSRELFRKELAKCINWMGDSELENFKKWCYANFKEMYPEILKEAFTAEVAA